MTTDGTADPHNEYRRQAAAHFDRPIPAPSTSPPRPPIEAKKPAAPPRIFRVPEDSPTQAEQLQPIPPPDAETGPSNESAARLLRESSQRFSAGTTYTGSGQRQEPTPDRSPTPPRGQPPSYPKPAISAPPQPRPYVDPPPPLPSPTPASAVGSPVQPAPGFQPHHAFWVAAALALVAVFGLGLGWLLVATGFAAAGWYTKSKGISWPPDIEDALVARGLTQPTQHQQPNGQPSAAGPPEPLQFIPFRQMTVPELFSSAFKIVWRNWPTLVGGPIAILIAFVATITVVFLIGSQMMASAATSVFSDAMASPAGGLGGLLTGVAAIMFVFMGLTYALALPADALLIALSVRATDKAVRGERVRFGDLFGLARGHMFAVCRLTLFYYTVLGILPDLVVTAALYALFFNAGAFSIGAFYLLLFAIFACSFVLNLVFSLSPIVLVLEKRGVMDSLKRSTQLAKPVIGRLLLIHALWAVCVIPVLMVPSVVVGLVTGFIGQILFMFLAFGALIAFFRTLQVLIYTDLRIRQESYDRELLADWTRNARP
ncbi:conserved membrane hypothetical protein [uncultured Mycobacterium sp.]|uniref:Transmembrane protein n=1 Tax=uncultured Mycobacterium sp. TaxID=171292 RepID=A0A1Y5P9U9_9MYCO|nr:conserved membrane hypothetical protein [uncultured Mycobacterium sp.]